MLRQAEGKRRVKKSPWILFPTPNLQCTNSKRHAGDGEREGERQEERMDSKGGQESLEAPFSRMKAGGRSSQVFGAKAALAPNAPKRDRHCRSGASPDL